MDLPLLYIKLSEVSVVVEILDGSVEEEEDAPELPLLLILTGAMPRAPPPEHSPWPANPELAAAGSGGPSHAGRKAKGGEAELDMGKRRRVASRGHRYSP